MVYGLVEVGAYTFFGSIWISGKDVAAAKPAVSYSQLTLPT